MRPRIEAAAIGRLEKIGDVVAGAERAGRAGEHDAADRVGRVRFVQRAVISRYIASVSAFFFSGRFIRMVRTPASSVTAATSLIRT